MDQGNKRHIKTKSRQTHKADFDRLRAQVELSLNKITRTTSNEWS